MIIRLYLGRIAKGNLRVFLDKSVALYLIVARAKAPQGLLQPNLAGDSLHIIAKYLLTEYLGSLLGVVQASVEEVSRHEQHRF